MKPLSELGISPTPWEHDFCGRVTESTSGDFVANSNNPNNARLIAESPNLYRDLYDAVYERCSKCDDTNIEHCRGKCFVAEWRDTLSRASGEEVAK